MMNLRLETKLAGLALAAAFACAHTSQAATMLYDFNDRGSNITQAGWLAATAANGVTFAGVGGVGIDDRDRGTGNTNGAGGDTANNDMWRDFIFAPNSNTPTEGMDVTISNLLPDQLYSVQLWAYDDSSNGGISSLWNGAHVLTFPDGPDPSSLNDYTVVFDALTDGAGTLLLQGRAITSSNNQNVFLNGLALTAIPSPTAALAGLIGLAGLGMRRRRSH